MEADERQEIATRREEGKLRNEIRDGGQHRRMVQRVVRKVRTLKDCLDPTLNARRAGRT